MKINKGQQPEEIAEQIINEWCHGNWEGSDTNYPKLKKIISAAILQACKFSARMDVWC